MKRHGAKRVLHRLNPVRRLKYSRALKAEREIDQKIKQNDRKIEVLKDAVKKLIKEGRLMPQVEKMAGQKRESHSPEMWEDMINAEMRSLQKININLLIERDRVRERRRTLLKGGQAKPASGPK